MTAIVLGSRRSARLIERNMLVTRHNWLIIASGFFEPLFYLLSIGLGVGHLVGDVKGPGGQTLTYAEFVASAMMASSAMNGAIYESTMNVYYKLKYAKTYDAILSTPMSVGDVALGEIGWCLGRGAIYGVGFLVVMTVMGLVGSWTAVFALPAAVLIGFAFAATGMAATSYVRTWSDFEVVQLVVMPLFLFSATFTPLSTYPTGMQVLIRLTPLYHGVALIRGCTTGTLGPGALIDVAYLAIMGAVGVLIASRRLGQLLLP